ncbi:biotin/lipoate A/B protein ligase family protein [Bacillus carboniphilus]|uniref:Octanoyl-[GcvH]:protein N-octanoyltransferase n=1 Tax=Bacillus carboniphilus TaxID=86663 RepID=A0ABY9JSN7_9BACI|nr:biotin/lipoate A/B protein ligase family protein [Bacillus carboniphilus]WLR41753.1 biotin/lipoate A/B protein ligase family protein [Bacillus carboniphilus]
MNIELLKQPKWRLIDHSSIGLTFDPKHSFAYDDTLCAVVGKGTNAPVVRTWVHEKTIVLGIQDTRTPHLSEGVNYLRKAGYNVIVRNSGGLAVVLDKEILNISLIFPEESMDINRGYDAMFALMKLMFADDDIEINAFEVEGSYCPGSYDLSIHSKKFAGISQRRLRGGVAVQIYLCVSGSGKERAEHIKRFYELAINNQPTSFKYPNIVPGTMASLSELIGVPLSINDLMYKLLVTLKGLGAVIVPESFNPEELSLYEKNVDRMNKRNDKVFY